MTWEATDLWKPGRPGTASGGSARRCSETGALGFCKPTEIWQEKVASDLGRALGLSIPEVRLGTATGYPGMVAVSVVFGTESLDIARLRERFSDLFDSTPVQAALRAASGLIPFFAWIKNSDLKDDHLLYTTDDTGQRYEVAAIDFAYAFQWTAADAAQVDAPTGPAALVAHPDPAVITSAVDRILAFTDGDISAILDRLPEGVFSTPEKGRVLSGLQARRPGIRGAMQSKNWLSP